MLTFIILISILYAVYLLVIYWEKLAAKEKKENDYPKAGKGIRLDDSEDFY